MRMDHINNTPNMSRSAHYDVVCGKNSFNNPGNEYFRKLVQLHRNKYRSTKNRQEKRRVVQHIIEKIHGRGGRFLKSETKDQEIPFTVQYEKVSHALRSARAPITAVVQTRADMAGNVNNLLAKQRQLFQQYCQEASFESPSITTTTSSDSSISDQHDQPLLEPALSQTTSFSLDKLSLGLILSAFDAEAL